MLVYGAIFKLFFEFMAQDGGPAPSVGVPLVVVCIGAALVLCGAVTAERRRAAVPPLVAPAVAVLTVAAGLPFAAAVALALLGTFVAAFIMQNRGGCRPGG